jgi:hypothetical protein
LRLSMRLPDPQSMRLSMRLRAPVCVS